MRLRKFGDILLATYGVITAIDKLDGLIKDEQEYKERKRMKKRMRGKTLYTDFERLTFQNKDSAFRFLDMIRDHIDICGVVTAADVYRWKGLPITSYDYRIGWHVIYDNQAKVKKQGHDNYILILPRPEYLSEDL